MSVPAECNFSVENPGSVAGRYYVLLSNQAGENVALLDTWQDLNYTKKVNGVDTCSLVLDANDPRIALFELDSRVRVYRSVPGCELAWYVDFCGLHRKWDTGIARDGRFTFTSESVGLNDLLARTTIAYKGGTIRADKNAPAETVMKEYVYENCGLLASTSSVVGRLFEGVLPGFIVEATSGAGKTWSGSRPFENLLDVLKEIANFSGIDFEVAEHGQVGFQFKTHVGQLGEDRTTTGLDTTTGRNSVGNEPVVISTLFGNVQDIKHTIDRLSEANVVLVLGSGELSTQIVNTVAANTIYDSPWNRREVSRPASHQEYEYQRIAFGQEVIEEMKAKRNFDFTPLQQPSCLYGEHYFLGDRVTVRMGEFERNERIIGVKIRVSAEKEEISVELGDKT
jgi:hypothetical protein